MIAHTTRPPSRPPPSTDRLPPLVPFLTPHDPPPPSRAGYSVDDALTAVGFGRFHLSLLAYAGLAWAGEAMELLLLSFVGPAAASEWAVGPQWEAAVASVVFLGMMGGAYAWGILADDKGRR